MTSEGRKRKAAYDTSMGQPQWEAGRGVEYRALLASATRASRRRPGAETARHANP